MTRTIINKLNEFKKARRELIEVINKFPKDNRSEKLFGEWDLKNVVAHFSAWDLKFTSIIDSLIIDKVPEHWGNIDKFNEEEVNKRKTWSWEKTYNEFIKNGRRFINVYSNLDSELLNKQIWVNRKYTPEKILKVNIHHYKKAQLTEINKLLEKWKK